VTPLMAGGPPGVSRGQGQQLARAELSKAIYHPSVPFLLRIYDAIQHALARLYDDINSATPGGWWGFAALLALVVIVVGVVLVSVGPVGRQHRRPPAPLWAGRALTAAERREQASRLAASGDFSAAILECMRAIAAGLEERAVIMANPGLTADELASEAGRALPDHAGELRWAASLFDDICYGQRKGTKDEYERLRGLDAATVTARPAPLTTEPGSLTTKPDPLTTSGAGV
jgi:hypothetical protein